MPTLLEFEEPAIANQESRTSPLSLLPYRQHRINRVAFVKNCKVFSWQIG
ncbi:hypothetical protein H6G17_00360 [Chroococcidiopsis sp. FACHB-1243]|nr:hypothetical protein [Chroococcidiopsis sp. [FACHB-1243]]MBD2303973.1 hypothetical protein [Chroococcidiopsis sp. [FACHB-1243]]